MKISTGFTLLFAVLLALFTTGSKSFATDDVKAAYVDRTIRLIVGYGAGGGYDAFARLIAPELERETGANVVVQNKSGAGGLAVLNDVARTDSDIATLTIANVSAAVNAKLIGSEAARFSVTDFVWLGGISSDKRVLLMAAGTSLADWRSTPQSPALIRWAAGGKTDNLALSAALLSEAFGFNSKIITGYKGSNEAIAALLRGEADGTVVSIETAMNFVHETDLTIAAVLSDKRSKLAPDLPTLYEMDMHPASREWIDYQVNLSTLGRALIIAPGTPQANVDFLRQALQRILTDPDFIKSAAERGRAINFVTAGAIASATNSVLDPASNVDRDALLTVLGQKYF
ncbi:tripartite tricarboxylate transporter substrate-binding protein [Pararhizobium sp. IMCC21322]|uniref:tripartite tricarboxylate transporter substrate-binding protein n=1 Tax=Pararhizobium sp. IMCC21322 TaxID=3067903 RepID=UPI0027404B42|nr:tripartite tricarboxylate transporter substrate-binding protein [Pararhizobium sp. IMCC21322]